MGAALLRPGVDSINKDTRWLPRVPPATVTGEDAEVTSSPLSLISVGDGGQPITTLQRFIQLAQRLRQRTGRSVPLTCVRDDESHTPSKTRVIIAVVNTGCRRRIMPG